MHALALKRLLRKLTLSISVLFLASCGQGDGPVSIAGTAATPLPPIPPGFCDAINFEIVCPPATIVNFNGGATTIIDNPDPTGINDSEKVAQMQKFPDEVFGGTKLELDSAIDFGAGEAYTIKVWSPRSVEVLFKLEETGNPGGGFSATVNHGGGGTWEELCFDFAGQNVPPPVIALTIIFDNGTQGAADTDPGNWTFYYDDIEQVASCPGGGGGGGSGSARALTDFEDAGAPYTFTDFDGGTATVVDNPDVSGIDVSARVGQMQKFAGEIWAGTTLDMGGDVDWSGGEVWTMKVRSSRVVPVLFKWEGLNQERSVDHGGSGTWEELCFDFTGTTGGAAATELSLIFDLGVVGDAAGDPANWTFEFDDITQVASCPGGGGGGGNAPTSTDFEGAGPFTFSDFDGGVATVIANPDASGINLSATVAQMEKFAGQPWGGSTLDLGGAVDWSAGEVYTMKVWSSRVVDVLLKLEGLNQERTATHGGTGWELLCFDFSGATGGAAATAITLIFDNGVMGDAAGDAANWTFQFDDIEQVASCPGGGGGGGGSGSADIDFEAAGAGAGFTWSTFENVDNPALEIVANPVSGGINTSATVARFTARLGGQPWAGVETAHGDIGPLTLDATNSTVKIMVYKSVISDVGVKFAIANGGAQTEIKVANTVIDQWEELTFDFSGNIGLAESINIDQIIVFGDFDLAGRTQDNIVYFDNIAFTDGTGGGGGGSGAPVLTDFEGAGPFTFSDFDGGAATVIANPDASGINTSATVGQMQKFAGQPWGGSTLDLGGAVDWSAGEVYTMKVRSSRVVDVLLKLEGLNQERTATHGGTGWELLCFDFTGTTGGAPATAITLIFDNGVMGDAVGDPANWTFEFDDIEQAASCPGGGGGGGGAFAPITFDDAGITYTLTDFGGNTSVVTNDPAGGANMVTQSIKSNVAELWAGTTISTEANEAIPVIPLDAANTQMTVRVYSPDAGIPVRLKVEDASNNTITVETEATTSMVNAWETLTFDFANPAAGTAAFNEANTYNKVSIFFNFGTTGAVAGEKIYYFDDIDVVAGGGGGGPSGARALTDFEDAGGPYTFSDFDGGIATAVNNPDVSGIDTSAKVGQMQKFAGEVWGGTTLDMGGDVDWSGGEVWTMKVRSSRVVPVLFKWEGLNQERSVDHGGSGTWEELCFDFSGATGGAAATALTLIFDLGVVGDAAGDPANWTFEFDDITQVASCPGGGGGSSGSADIDFEAAGAGAGFTWSTFENVDNPALEIVTNPNTNIVNPSSTVAKFTARLGGQPWAGVETAHGDIGPLTLDATNSMVKIMVYKSVISDVGVKFAIANGGAQTEIKVANTVIDQWEELTFDFSGNIGLAESINIDQIIVFGDFDLAGRTQDNIVYFDNIAFTAP